MRAERRHLLLAAALLLAACAPAPRVEPRPRLPADDRARADRFEATLDSLRREKGILGLAAVVLRDTTVILARGYGWADVERQVPVTPETPFNIASVTKPISGVVALRLVEQGVLDLDRPMSSFADFREFCTDVREAGGIFFGDFACEGDALTLRHVLMMQANGAPGTRFWYDPPVFSWASRPMAEVGGFVKEHAGERLLWHTGLWEGAYSALYLKVPGRRLTLILLANSEALQWEAGCDEAAIERSPFATAFLAAFPR